MLGPMLTNIIPVAALIISALTFIATQIANQHALRRDSLDSLERRVQELEAELKASHEREQALTRENIELLRQLAGCANVKCPVADCPLKKSLHLLP